ncbi:MAG: copper oxidase [Methylococcales symbiont of Iophon sp. n. MRB-2018]|nr:MAG: copper oxidase [Methylococcales symbiont of Iophon sp. n. MRB-2018]KAF3978891.1 MAG: copper oxidase [Methylococcales symbiont of Iophon sp. n. MRB-2018]
MRHLLFIALLSLFVSSPVFAKKEFMVHDRLMDHGDGHLMDMDGGMVMGQNKDILPGGCDKIAATKEITVHAGHKYAKKFPGTMFAFDTQEYQFEPCTKLTVHFVNDDNIRHQWMMHGLPKYLYPKGMFHLEVTGPGKISGTLIFPPNDKTYLVHCDISQHMEKGMKGQLKIGDGSGDLPSIPGLTAYVIQDDYSNSIPEQLIIPATKKEQEAKATKASEASNSGLSGVMIIGIIAGVLLAPLLIRRFKGMSSAEIISAIIEMISQGIAMLIKLISALIEKFTAKKAIELADK